MFDAARLMAFLWTFAVVMRARAWLEATAVVVVAYFFALAVASGFTVRSEGPLEPMVAIMLALIGPTALPRGALPPLPGAHFVLAWPAAINALACAALLVRTARLSVRVDTLPESSTETRRLDRVGRALVLLAAFEGMTAGVRVLPYMLDRSWGGDDPIFEEAPGLTPR